MKNQKAFVALITIISLISISLPFTSTGELPVGLPPPTGDWTVSDHTAINDTNFTVNGNLTITSSGILELTNVSMVMNGDIKVNGDFILKNVSLTMNCTTNGSYGIVVESNGLMHILDYDGNPGTDDGSVITTGISDGKHCYTFWVKTNSIFKIENSDLQECGYGTFIVDVDEGNKGLVIETDSVQITNSTISYLKNGVIIYSSNNIISNCTFERGPSFPMPVYGTNGLIFKNGDYNTINECKFYEILNSISLYSSDNNIISNCQIEDSVINIQLERETVGIYNLGSNNNRFINNTENMIYSGIRFRDCTQMFVQNYSITETSYGIDLVGVTEYITLENLDMKNIYNPSPSNLVVAGISLDDSHAHIYVSNCSIFNPYTDNNDGIMWYFPTKSNDLHFKNCTVDVYGAALAPHAAYEPASNLISNVVIEDSRFNGDLHAFAALYRLDNWTLSNCTFESSCGNWRDFAQGVVNINNEAKDVNFTDCQFYNTNPSHGENGLVVSSYYNDLAFDLQFNNCCFFNNTKNGILTIGQGNSIEGTLTLNNCNLYDNQVCGIESNSDDTICTFNDCNISSNGIHGFQINFPFNSEFLIRNCTLADNDFSGINIYTADSRCKIGVEDCSFENNLNAIKTFYSNCNIHIQNSDFIENQHNALEITGGKLEINKCNISKNIKSGLWIDSSNINISNTEISENQECGLDIRYCNGQISGNQIMNNHLEGIKGDKCKINLAIENNLMKNNGQLSDISGISIQESTVNIKNNAITTGSQVSRKTAARVFFCPAVNIVGNIFNGNFTDDIIDIERSYGKIEDNQLLNAFSQCTGVYCHNLNSVQISNNIISAPGKYGIDVSDYVSASILGNTISGWEVGILQNNSEGAIENNILSDNELGISLIDVTTLVKNNTIQDSNIYAIHIHDNSNANLTDNTLSNNELGVLLEGTVSMNNNIIRNSADSGLKVMPEGEATLVNNIFKANNKGIVINSAKLTTHNNILKANKCGLCLINSKEGSFKKDKIENNDIGIESRDSIFNISQYSFENNNDTISLLGSVCKIYNSSITGSDRNFIINKESKCLVINTEMTEGPMNILDEKSELEIQWFLNITIINSANETLSDIEVVIKNKDGNIVFSGKTSNQGLINWLNLTSIQWFSTG